MTAPSWPRPVHGLDLRIIIASILLLLGLMGGVQAAAYGPLALGMERIVLLIALAGGFAFTLQWRQGIYLILVYVTIEGFVTNLLYPSTLPLLYKDFLIAGAYLGFLLPILQGHKQEVAPSSVVRPTVVLARLSLVRGFNPRGPDPAVAVIGA